MHYKKELNALQTKKKIDIQPYVLKERLQVQYKLISLKASSFRKNKYL